MDMHANGLPARPGGRHARVGRGNTLIEMAVCLVVLVYLSMGMVEFGQYFYIKHCFEGAVRDGGRYGILATATQSQVANTIASTLLQANVTYSPSWLTMTDITAGTAVTDVAQVPAGDQVQYTLSTSYASIPNAVRPLYAITGHGIGAGKVISVTCIMVKE